MQIISHYQHVSLHAPALRKQRTQECDTDAPKYATLRTPKRVENVSTPNFRSPSTSARSFVIAMTVAKTVTKQVMNLDRRIN